MSFGSQPGQQPGLPSSAQLRHVETLRTQLIHIHPASQDSPPPLVLASVYERLQRPWVQVQASQLLCDLEQIALLSFFTCKVMIVTLPRKAAIRTE